jgi:hypothetical protein
MYVSRNLDTGTIRAGGRKSNLGKIVKVEFKVGGYAVVHRLGRDQKWYSKKASRWFRNYKS